MWGIFGRSALARTFAAIGPIWLAALGLLFGGVTGAGAYTANYAQATSYLSDDPKACVNCHIMRDVFDSWQKSSHHAFATCNTCHLPHTFVEKWIAKARSGFNHSRAFTMQDFEEPIRIQSVDARIVEANCIDCHAGRVSAVLTSHSGNKTDAGNMLGCAQCHANVGHSSRR